MAMRHDDRRAAISGTTVVIIRAVTRKIVHGYAEMDQRREQLDAVIIIDSLADKSCVL